MRSGDGAALGGPDLYGSSAVDAPHRHMGGAASSLQASSVCVAAVKCLHAVKPLLTYWFQLPQHSEAVVTIIDRAVRGFISCARDELENLNWKLQSADKAVLKPILSGMAADVFFLEYRKSVYGDNCATVDELLGLKEPSSGNALVCVWYLIQSCLVCNYLLVRLLTT